MYSYVVLPAGYLDAHQEEGETVQVREADKYTPPTQSAALLDGGVALRGGTSYCEQRLNSRRHGGS